MPGTARKPLPANERRGLAGPTENSRSPQVQLGPNNSSQIRFDRFRYSDYGWITPVNGCSISTGVSGAWKADFSDVEGREDFGVQLDIDASKSNSIFGASSTVQPSSLRALVLIRSF